MLLECVHPDFRVTVRPRHWIKSGEDELHEIECLNDFPIVPPDYVYLYLTYGLIEFCAEYGDKNELDYEVVLIELMAPEESSEYFFKMELQNKIPGMFLLAGTGGANYLYYGKLREKVGVYIYDRIILDRDEGIFVADTLGDIVFKGIGLDILREHT